MLKQSYGSIINSLIKLQGRRRSENPEKKEEEAKADKPSADTAATTTAEGNDGEGMVMPQTSCIVNKDKYDMDLFVNPQTRDDTFQLLFAEVSVLLSISPPPLPPDSLHPSHQGGASEHQNRTISHRLLRPQGELSA